MARRTFSHRDIGGTLKNSGSSRKHEGARTRSFAFLRERVGVFALDVHCNPHSRSFKSYLFIFSFCFLASDSPSHVQKSPLFKAPLFFKA